MIRNFKLSYFLGAILTTLMVLSSCSKDEELIIPPVKEYTVSFAAGNNGTVTPKGEQKAVEGTIIESTASANNNYFFAGWFEGDNQVTETSGDVFVSNNGLTLNVKSSLGVNTKTYTANFTPNSYTVNFRAMTDGSESTIGGTVSPTSATGDFGTVIESIASVNTDYILAGWYDYNGKKIISTNPSAAAYLKRDGLGLNVKYSSTVDGQTYEAKFVNIAPQPGVAAPRIYVVGEGDQAKLMLTKDPTNYGAFFQWGRTVAWGNGEAVVKLFDPRNSQGGTSWKNQIVGPVYPLHTSANLKAGKGDPCKLVGFTQKFIEDELNSGIAPDNGKWRMPTKEENQTFRETYSDWKTLDGINGRYFGPGATSLGTDGEFLPAAGSRNSGSGSLSDQGKNGEYWSCAPTGFPSLYGSILKFTYTTAKEDRANQSIGLPVRCVPQ
ncbi:MAG: InlB B-repeat-containing protein [Phocaeicola sp.]